MKHVKPKVEYLTPAQLARKTWFPFNSKETVIKHIKQGKLPAIKISGGRYAILISDAKKYARLKHKWVNG